MSQKSSYWASALLMLMVGGQGVHWLITPQSDIVARWWAVVAQAVLGTAAGVWLLIRAKREAGSN